MAKGFSCETPVVELHGLRLAVPDGVLPPIGLSAARFIVDNFSSLGLAQPEPGQALLDLGTDVGSVGLIARKHGWLVTAADSNPTAVDAARMNAVFNDLPMRVVHTDRVSPMQAFPGEKFDVIVFNQPYFAIHPSVSAGAALEAWLGSMHVSANAALLRAMAEHLRPGGRVVLPYSNGSPPELLELPDWRFELRAMAHDAQAHFTRALFLVTPK